MQLCGDRWFLFIDRDKDRTLCTHSRDTPRHNCIPSPEATSGSNICIFSGWLEIVGAIFSSWQTPLIGFFRIKRTSQYCRVRRACGRGKEVKTSTLDDLLASNNFLSSPSLPLKKWKRGALSAKHTISKTIH